MNITHEEQSFDRAQKRVQTETADQSNIQSINRLIYMIDKQNREEMTHPSNNYSSFDKSIFDLTCLMIKQRHEERIQSLNELNDQSINQLRRRSDAFYTNDHQTFNQSTSHPISHPSYQSNQSTDQSTLETSHNTDQLKIPHLFSKESAFIIFQGDLTTKQYKRIEMKGIMISRWLALIPGNFFRKAQDATCMHVQFSINHTVYFGRCRPDMYYYKIPNQQFSICAIDPRLKKKDHDDIYDLVVGSSSDINVHSDQSSNEYLSSIQSPVQSLGSSNLSLIHVHFDQTLEQFEFTKEFTGVVNYQQDSLTINDDIILTPGLPIFDETHNIIGIIKSQTSKSQYTFITTDLIVQNLILQLGTLITKDALSANDWHLRKFLYLTKTIGKISDKMIHSDGFIEWMNASKEFGRSIPIVEIEPAIFDYNEFHQKAHSWFVTLTSEPNHKNATITGMDIKLDGSLTFYVSGTCKLEEIKQSIEKTIDSNIMYNITGGESMRLLSADTSTREGRLIAKQSFNSHLECSPGVFLYSSRDSKHLLTCSFHNEAQDDQDVTIQGEKEKPIGRIDCQVSEDCCDFTLISLTAQSQQKCTSVLNELVANKKKTQNSRFLPQLSNRDSNFNSAEFLDRIKKRTISSLVMFIVPAVHFDQSATNFIIKSYLPDQKHFIRILGDLYDSVYAGKETDSKIEYSDILKVGRLRTITGIPVVSETGWSGSRVYCQLGFLGTILGQYVDVKTHESISLVATVWNAMKHVEWISRELFICSCNLDTDEKELKLLREAIYMDKHRYITSQILKN